MIPVAVCGQHRGDLYSVVGGQSEQCWGVSGGVDKQRLVTGAQQVAIVVHLGHGNFMKLEGVVHKSNHTGTF